MAASTAALLLLVAADPAAGEPAARGDEARVDPVLLIQTDAIPYAGADTSAARGDAATLAGFRLRRVRAGLDARQGRWQARAVLELGAEGDAGRQASVRDPGRPRVTDAFVRWQPAAAFHAEAGSLRPPFSLSRQADEADLRLPERPLSVQAIAPEWRVGASAGGDLGIFQYAAGLYANDEPDVDGDVAVRGTLLAARLAAEPLGPIGVAPWLRRASDPWWPWWRYAVGGSFFHDWRSGHDTFGLGADAAFQRRRWTVTGEVLWARRLPQRLGVVIEPGVFVWRDRLEIVARGEWFDARYGFPDAADAWTAAAGATYHAWSRRARLSAMFHHRQDIHGDRRNDWALLRLGFGFGL